MAGEAPKEGALAAGVGSARTRGRGAGGEPRGCTWGAPVWSAAPPIFNSIFWTRFLGLSPRPRRCLGSRSLSLGLLQTTTSDSLVSVSEASAGRQVHFSPSRSQGRLEQGGGGSVLREAGPFVDAPPPRSVGMNIAFHIPWSLHFLLTVKRCLSEGLQASFRSKMFKRASFDFGRPGFVFAAPWGWSCPWICPALPSQCSHPNLPPHLLLRTELRQRFVPPARGHLYLPSVPQLSPVLGVIMNDGVMFFS